MADMEAKPSKEYLSRSLSVGSVYLKNFTLAKADSLRPKSSSVCVDCWTFENLTLEEMLSLFVSENQTDWKGLLPCLLMAYRSSEHESTKLSPAEVMLGWKVTLPLSAQLPQTNL